MIYALSAITVPNSFFKTHQQPIESFSYYIIFKDFIENERNMKIYPSATKKDLNDFINLPFKIYQSDPMWVPPLKSELHNQFKPAKNPYLDHCNFMLFLLKDNESSRQDRRLH